MAGITTFLDESKMPNRSQEQKVFDNLVAYVFQNFPKWGREVNESLGAFNAALAGGAYALPYIFDAATADADPGAGKLRLSSATQNAATVMRLDLTAGGQDYTTLLDTMDGSTSVIKGSIRLVKQGDMSKWMTFDVTARAAPASYRNLTVACTGSSSASPFVNGDTVILFFQRNGDRGQAGASGLIHLATANVSTAVANIDFLNIFTSDYDKYTVEITGMLGTDTVSLRCQLAFAGIIDSTAIYKGASAEAGDSSASTSLLLVPSMSPFDVVNATVEFRGMNTTTGALKGVGIRGAYRTNTAGYAALLREGLCLRNNVASGFRLSANFGSGIVRVYGHRNS